MMSFKMLRKQLMIFLAHQVALPYFKLVRKNYRFPYTVSQLAAYADGTVGRELYLFFHHHNLDILPHYEKHDIKHVVLGYPPTEEGEVSLQCFMLANGRITLPVLCSVAVGFLIMPEHWKSFKKAWIKGRQTPQLDQLDWFSLIPRPLTAVKHQIFNTKNK